MAPGIQQAVECGRQEVCVCVSQMVLAAEMLVPVMTEWIPGNISGISTTAVACRSVTLFFSFLMYFLELS